MNNNDNLSNARKIKNDEFYTLLTDIEKELMHYKDMFVGKTIYCNCDDPVKSNFVQWFYMRFNILHLKRIIVTAYNSDTCNGGGYYWDSNFATVDPKSLDISKEISKDVRKLNGDGDFRSDECIELLKQADIVVTNPPFSLFREYVRVLVDHNKDFLILGNINAITYRIVLQNFKENKIRFGFTNGAKTFILPNGDKKAVRISWFTTLPVSKHNEDLILFRKYVPEAYPKYDNYDAINVDKTCDIPADYDGAMGVPITFLDKYDPKQFEIIDGFNRYSFLTGPTEQTQGKYLSKINGIPKYARIIIKKKDCMNNNDNLSNARKIKNDEFYTLLTDIEKELMHYKDMFVGKTIYCNCDDPVKSNFVQWFYMRFNILHLKRIIVTAYNSDTCNGGGYYWDSNFATVDPKAIDISKEIEKDIRKLNGNGDFRSDECIELLKQADIVVTNPPFSLFREYVKVLMDNNKDFVILGNMNAITYKEVFPYIKENRIGLGYLNGAKSFITPDGVEQKFGNIFWYTTLPIAKHNEELVLFRKYSPELYPKYDNYDAINVDKTCDIPEDYDGAMGVPISFLDKYDPKQFEIIDGFNRYSFLTGPTEQTQGKYLSKINDIPKYARIIIKKKQ